MFVSKSDTKVSKIFDICKSFGVFNFSLTIELIRVS